MNILIATAYIMMIVTANLLLLHYGANAAPLIAFIFIGFIMTSRDWLHDKWNGNNLILKMSLLITVGGALSFLINQDVRMIAIASVIAFTFSELVNFIVYQPMLTRKIPWLMRVNTGNVPNAIVDSVLFITIAFGFAPTIILLQIFVKIFGGAIWSILFSLAIRWRTI